MRLQLETILETLGPIGHMTKGIAHVIFHALVGQ